jgi:outer membrane lipoprotein-sorting protein
MRTDRQRRYKQVFEIALAAALCALIATESTAMAFAQTPPPPRHFGSPRPAVRRFGVPRTPPRQFGVANNRQPALNNIDPAARALLLKMLGAEKTLTISGEQTTLLYRDNGSVVQTTQTVYRDGSNNYRCEFHSPPHLAGEIVVSHDDMSWHYIPSSKTLRISAPHPRHLLTQIGPALAALKKGTASAAVVGSDQIAGLATQIVEIAGADATPTGRVRIWIDPTTGAQLKTEVYDAAGNLQSSSYFTSVNYQPTLPADAFEAPAVPPGTKTEVDRRYDQLSRFPTDSDAGFRVFKPTKLPPGYAFVSASIFQIAGRKAVALRYECGLALLSIFESPQEPNEPAGNAVSSPRAGTVVVNQGSMQFAAMGSLSDQDLLQVLRSLR